MPIQILPPVVAAQIAAGEVVERPASVAKELIENALDAGASQITIEMRGGGLRELRIQDNGCGIPAEEVELAFERHATSKIRSVDDLWSLATLGFRGEALPSIAAVAQVICTTRAASEPVGTELRLAGGEVQARKPIGCSPGTMFSVRNLFYNVPVRREFLRSEAAETGAVSAVVTQYALGYPDVRFTLVRDGRVVFQTNGDGNQRAVVLAIYGIDVARQLLEVAAEDAGVAVNGLISPPGLTRGSREGMHLFVNRRAIQPRGPVPAAIIDAYHTLLMKGRFPFVVLNLQIHPGAVDVNIHPTKSEVKFRGQDAAHVERTLGSAIRDALYQSDAVAPWRDSTPSAAPAAPARAAPAQSAPLWPEPDDSATQAAPGSGARPLREREAEFGVKEPGPAAAPPLERPTAPHRQVGESRAAHGQAAALGAGLAAIAAERRTATPALPPLQPLAQLGLAYILAAGPDNDLYIIDQHAAHERITYERLMAQRGAGSLESQALLAPEVLDLPPAARHLLLDAAAELEPWGFVVEEFGTQLRVRAIPATMAIADLPQALLEVADHLGGSGGTTPDDWREAMLTTLACHTSVRFGQHLSQVEMRGLIDQLGACNSPRTCPHGRPTVIVMTATQLARQFGRIH